MPVLTSFLDRIRTRGGNVALTGSDYHVAYNSWSSITEDTALTYSAVYAAVTLIADAIAAMPVHVYRSKRDGSAEQITSSNFNYLLQQPNPEVTNFTFWQTVMAHKVLTGNAYIFVVQNADRTPLELWPIEPHRVRVGRERDGKRRKIYTVDGENRPMIDYALDGEIVHLMSTPWDGLSGMSPIQKAAQALQLAGTARQYSTQLLDEGARPSGLLTTEAPITGDEAKALGERWDQLHSGDRRGRTAVLANGTKWQQVSISPVDAQLMEILKWGVTDVARWFRVPPHLIGDVERSTSWGTGIAEQNQNFLTYTLAPHLIPAEQTISNALLGGGSTYMRFNTGGLLRGSLKEQYEAHRIALGNQPFVTVDEVRGLLELAPMGGAAAELGTAVGATTGKEPSPAQETPPAEEPAAAESRAWNPYDALTEAMVDDFVNRDVSYGQIVIKYAIEGADPLDTVKKRMQRFCDSQYGMTPLELRRNRARET